MSAYGIRWIFCNALPVKHFSPVKMAGLVKLHGLLQQ
jgi:hypothetical protein